MRKLAVLLCLLSPAAFAECVLAGQDGALIWTADTVETCNGYWLMPATDYAAYVSALQITSTDLAAAFGWGFGAVILFGGISFHVGVARKLVDKV